MKTNIIIYVSRTHLAKFWVSSYGPPKWCQPSKLQDSLKELKDEVYFLHADKHRSLLRGDTIILGECN